MRHSLGSSLKSNSLTLALVAGLIVTVSMAAYSIGRGQEQTALLLVALIVGATLALRVARRRTLFAYVYVFVLGLEYISPAWGAGVITIPKLGAALLLVAYVINSHRRFSFRSLRLFWLALVVIGYFGATVLTGDDVDSGLVRSSTFVLLLVSYLLVVHYCETRAEVHTFLGAFVLYAIVTAVVAVVQFAQQQNSVTELLTEIRANSLAGNPNESAYYISLGLMIVLAQRAGQGPGWRWLPPRAQLGVGVLFAAAIITTGSRGVLTATVAAVVACLFLTRGRNRGRLLASVGLLIGGLVLINQMLPLLETLNLRIVDPLQANRDIMAGRLDIWEGALADFSESPLAGYGLGGYRYEGRVTHNTFLWALLDGGIVGGVLWIALWLAALLILMRIYRAASIELRSDWQADVVALSGMFVCSAVRGLSGNIETDKLFWCVLALLEASHLLMAASPSSLPRGANGLVD